MPKIKPHYLFFILLAFSLLYRNHACNQMDRNTMILSLPFSTSSPPLNWSSADCCNWEGIACDPRGYVTHISLPSKGLRGSIFPFLGNLTHLSYLNLSRNLLSSTLPRGLFSTLNQLTVLDISSNYLAGDLSFQFSSEGLLASIQVFDISSNYFNGTIQSSFLQRAWNLTKLNLSNNNFTGSLPQSLMKCTKLVELILRNNSFEGNITTLNFSGLQQLAVLDMGLNEFTSNFPISLHSCKSLRAIRISTNRLEGQIPLEVSQLSFLSFFSVTNNNLTNISEAIKILMRCKFLSVVIIGGNFFHETIPTDGSIAHSNGFKNVQLLSLVECHLTGQLPTWLSNLKKLEILHLSGNSIMGSIPNWISTLPRLKNLELSYNYFSGEFPKELCALPALISAQALEDETTLILPLFTTNGRMLYQYNSLLSFYPRISLCNNSLGGKIPIEIGRLKLLRVLDLSKNNFAGNIPGQISELTNLEGLNLSGNWFSGKIPVSLASLNFMSHFSIANNNLYGPIPSGTQLQSFGPSAYEGNAGLCGAPLPKDCTHTMSSNKDKETRDEKVGGHNIPWFPITVVLGFITGFWGVCGSLVFNCNWRNAYFQFLENLGNRLYVTMAVSWARLLRKLL